MPDQLGYDEKSYIFVTSNRSSESAANEIRSMVSLPRLGSGSLHKKFFKW